MEDKLLTEQLRRLKRLSEEISHARDVAREKSRATARDIDAMRSGPLQQVRDYRPYQNPRYRDYEPDAHRADSPPRTAIRESTRRRRRR